MNNPAINAPDWLTSHPIAHRGLHDNATGLVENTTAAALAAVAKGFAIECDVQLSRDGEAMIFHDLTLDRLMRTTGELAFRDARELKTLRYATGDQKIVTLEMFLAAINGRVPLICEIKSTFNGNMRLAQRTLAVVSAQNGPVALKSFDPEIIAHLRAQNVKLPLGMIAEAQYTDSDWDALSPALKQRLTHFLHYEQTRPDFLSYNIGDLPNGVPHLCRKGIGMPVMTWTIRTPEQRQLAAQWADQIVFEGFVP